jgi:hypothetical protein
MLQRGMTPAAALRDAQNSIRQEPRWQSPYYWAAFTLQGDYSHVIKATPPNFKSTLWKVVIAAAFLVQLLGVIWWFRRRLAHAL